MASPHPARDADAAVDVAHYLAFSRTWGAWWRGSDLDYQRVERRMMRYLRQLCRWVEPTLVLEIGAHEASFSRWAAEEFPDVPVVAFEANPHVHAKYAERLGATRVDYRNVAVGPVSGDITLHVPTEVRGRSKKLTSAMASLGQHTAAGGSVEVTVPCVRLDDEFSVGAADRVVAWVDVEGANGLVLESGPELLSRLQVLHVEVEMETTWEEQWLDVDVAVHLKRHGMVPVARDIQKKGHQHNVVYVRAEMLHDLRITRRAARMLRGDDAGTTTADE
jgi:FkbM family methyltransferase